MQVLLFPFTNFLYTLTLHFQEMFFLLIVHVHVYRSEVHSQLYNTDMFMYFTLIQICHPSGAALTGELIKNSRVVMVDKCGHAMTMDRPRKCAKLVKDFIKQQT